MNPFDDWTPEDDAYLERLNEQRARNGLPPMSRDEYQDYSDDGNPPDTRTTEEKLEEHNAWRARNGHAPHTEREYLEFVANAPRFDWAGTREALLEAGWSEDDPAIQHCREMQTKEEAHAKALQTTKGVKS